LSKIDSTSEALERLKQAVEVGREDVRLGRVIEVDAKEIAAFVARLGRSARPTRPPT
jgi:glycerate-2-kinase